MYSQTTSSSRPPKIYEISFSCRNRLAEALELNDDWMKLADSIGIPTTRIFHIQRHQSLRCSPTQEILNEWSRKNPTVCTLRSHLVECRLMRAVQILDSFYPQFVPSNERHVVSFDENTPPPRSNGLSYESLANNQSMNVCGQILDSTGLPVPSITDPEIEELSNICQAALSSQPPSYWTSINEGKATQDMIDPKYNDEKNDRYSGGACGRVLEERNRQDNTGVIFSTVNAFRYEELKACTNNFNESFYLGSGGFGTVYRVNMMGTVFAVKVLSKCGEGAGLTMDTQNQNKDGFVAELKALQKVRHKNVIMLAGCSTDGPARCLVYEYMVNGSLADHLAVKSKHEALPWVRRLNILKDTASGLQFMHSLTPAFIHCDIKSANILLGPHFEAKIADFGLAKAATGGSNPNQFTHITYVVNSQLFGTKEYLPDYFFKEKAFCVQTDTHAFGVVIFEVCTGQAVRNPSRQQINLSRHPPRFTEELPKMAHTINGDKPLSNRGRIIGDQAKLQFKDPMAEDCPNDLWLQILSIGDLCCPDLKEKVPKMKFIQYAIEKIVKSSQDRKYRTVPSNSARKVPVAMQRIAAPGNKDEAIKPPERVNPPSAHITNQRFTQQASQGICNENVVPAMSAFYPASANRFEDEISRNLNADGGRSAQPMRCTKGPRLANRDKNESEDRRSVDGADESALIKQLEEEDFNEQVERMRNKPDPFAGFDQDNDADSVCESLQFDDLSINSDDSKIAGRVDVNHRGIAADPDAQNRLPGFMNIAQQFNGYTEQHDISHGYEGTAMISSFLSATEAENLANAALPWSSCENDSPDEAEGAVGGNYNENLYHAQNESNGGQGECSNFHLMASRPQDIATFDAASNCSEFYAPSIVDDDDESVSGFSNVNIPSNLSKYQCNGAARGDAQGFACGSEASVFRPNHFAENSRERPNGDRILSNNCDSENGLSNKQKLLRQKALEM